MRRQEILSLAPPRDTWPTVNADELDEQRRELFENRCKAINLYLDGEAVSVIQQVTGIQYNSLSFLVKKCLLSSSDGRILGYRALLPFKNIASYVRTSKVKHKYPEAHGGMSGLLRQTLNQFPQIDKQLRQLIYKKNSPNMNVHEKKIRAKNIHSKFIKMLKAAGVSDHEWPFNTKYLGLRSIYSYLDDVLNESFGRTVQLREERAAAAHAAVGRGERSFLSFEEPFEAVEIDAYNINAFFTAEFGTPEGTVSEVLLERIWLIAMIEVISKAILAYSVVYRSEVSADDVVGVIRKAINEPERVEITIPGLVYPEKGGFPAEVLPQYKEAAWGVMFLDGALAHLSEAVHSRARRALGFSINWGPVGHFERRPNIERFFSRVSTELFMRYPSTTGSNPGKGRAQKAEEKALQYKIRADEAEQVLAIFVAQYNDTPTEGNSYNSPLDTLRHYAEGMPKHFLIRKLPQRAPGSILIPLRRVCTIRGGRKEGRRPYVQFERVRYTNTALAHASGLIGKKLILEFDENDLRFCNAYLEDGAELGRLKAGARWYLTKHSFKTRKIINSLIYKRILTLCEYDDPVQKYFDHLSKQRKAKGSRKRVDPKSATEAARIANESGLKRKMVASKPGYVSGSRMQPPTQPSGRLMGPLPDLNELLKRKK